QAAVDLSLDYHRIDDVAAIVHGDEASHFDLAGPFVDVDNAYIGSKREGKVRRIIVVDRFQAGFEARRDIGICGKGEFLDRLGLVRGAPDIKLARLPFQILFTDFHQVCCYLFCLVAYLSRRHCGGRSGNRSAAAGIGAQAVRSSVGVAFLYRDSGYWNSQLLRDYLCKRGLMSLSLRFRSKPRRGLAGRMDPDLATIEHLQTRYIVSMGRPCAHDFGEARNTDPH